eukprot:scaffold32007_cov101-Isochrysis_galbana.AAC.2
MGRASHPSAGTRLPDASRAQYASRAGVPKLPASSPQWYFSSRHPRQGQCIKSSRTIGHVLLALRRILSALPRPPRSAAVGSPAYALVPASVPVGSGMAARARQHHQ